MATKKHEQPEGNEAVVMTSGGGVIRTYTREDHGDNFMELAKQMAEQHPGSTIDVH